MSDDKVEVHVVMGNDFPDAVFSTEEAAEKYCDQKRAEYKAQKERDGIRFYPPIYWRFYSFPLRDE